MKNQIKDYLNLINSEIQKRYADEINLRETDFEKYSIFDFANFHLIYQYILDDNNKKPRQAGVFFNVRRQCPPRYALRTSSLTSSSWPVPVMRICPLTIT